MFEFTNQTCATHDRFLFSIDVDLQFRKISEDLGHLVAALAATNVDDDVGVGVLRQGLRDDRLAASKCT
jgi:hypothetical protein